jgi:putative ABC transport system permease protein
MKIYLEIALRNLLSAGRRTTLLSLAIAAVTFFLVLLLSLTQGIRSNVLTSATTLFSGHVNVGGFYKPSASEADPFVLESDRIREIVREETPNFDYVVDRTQGVARVIGERDSLFTLVMGIDITEETKFREVVQLAPESDYVEEGSPEVVEGDVSRLSEPKTALLFASQAKRLGVGVGDALTIRAETFSGVANTVDVNVVGVVRDVGLLSSFALFVPNQTLRRLYDLREDATGLVMVYLDDPDAAEPAMGELREALDEAGFELMEHDPQPTFAKFESVSNADWTGYRLDLTTWEDQISFVGWVLTAVNTVTFLIVLVLSILIGVGMANTILMAIRERISEIGTMRAIGMTRAGVLGLFMIEALTIGFAASTAGALLGAGAALGLDALQVHIPLEAVQAILMSDVLTLIPRPTHLALAVGGITLFIGLAALWPALQAARMTPVEAIHRTN